MPPKPRQLADRFAELAMAEPNSGCWLWCGTIGLHGYGVISYGGASGVRDARAHRVSWELHHGPIPAGLCVLHRCDNPPCVNPAHLFLGTPKDNMADKQAKGRQMRGLGYGGPTKLDPTRVRQIRAALRTGESKRSIAGRMGVSPGVIVGIVSGRLWRSVA